MPWGLTPLGSILYLPDKYRLSSLGLDPALLQGWLIRSLPLQKGNIMQKLFVGADVSKGYIDAVILNSMGKTICSREKFFDSANGHSMFSEWIKSVITKSTVVYIGVESTGGYENNWISLFSKIAKFYDVHYVRLNPRAVSNASKALLTRTVTDGVSATLIADYMIRYFDRITFDTIDPFSSLRRLWSSRELIQKAYNAQWMHLQQILYDANPIILSFTRDKLPQWVITLLKSYPTANKLARARPATLAKIPFITITRAHELITAAKETIAADSEDCTAFLIQQSIEIIANLAKQLGLLGKRLIEESANLPDMKLLCSIPGVGEITAVGLLINIGDINRFKTVKNLTSYFGLHPVFKKSGDGKTVSRMSKVGRKRPRTILYMSVMGGISTNPLLKEDYNKALEQGKAPRAAIGICMHKLLRIVYGILKSGKMFDIEVHNKHKNRKTSVEKTIHLVKKNESDMSAPISRREAKRQKDRIAESHEKQSSQLRDHQPPAQ